MFPPSFLVDGTRKHSMHCLISATTGPAAVPLDHGTVIFGMIDSQEQIHCFRESVYIHDALPFALFPVSCLSDREVYFDFYGTSSLFCGSLVFPFTQQEGLYMGKLLCADEMCAASVMCAAVLSPFISPSAFVAKTRSGAQAAIRAATPLVEEDIPQISAPHIDPGSPTVFVPDPVHDGQAAPTPAMTPRSSPSQDTESDTGGVNHLRHRLTGAGKLLLDLHDRRGHPHDRALKQMVDSKQSGCDHLSWVPGINIRDHCWSCLKGHQRRSKATINSTLLGESPLPCQVMVLDWCGPQHVTGLHGSLYWLLGVCPFKGYHWAATAQKKSEYPVLLDKMLRHVRGKVGDDRIRFLKFDGGPEFTTEPSNEIMRAWKLDFDQSCPDHHYQVGEVERGHSIHQNAMRTMSSHAQTPSLLWEELFPHSVALHNANLHKREDKSPFEFLTGLAPDTQFLFVWGCLGVVHNHSGHPDKFKERGIPCIYVGTGYFDNVHGAKFLNPETGKTLYSTNMTMTENFLPFKALAQNPGIVRDCFGMVGFRNMVGWSLVQHRVRKCFSGTWCIGVLKGYKIRQMWFVVEYSDGIEEYTATELSAIYFSGSLSPAFYLAFAIPMDNAIASLGIQSVVDYDADLNRQGDSAGKSVSLGSLMHDAAYSVDAVDALTPLFACINLAKSSVYRTVVHNPLFPLASSPVLVPKTDKQAQQQSCAEYWNAAKARCLDRHRELRAHEDVSHPPPGVQVLDTKWVFDLKLNPDTHQIDKFKARIVANGSPQILGYDCFDVHASTASMCEVKLLLAICAARDWELSHMDTTTAFISAPLKPNEVVFCYPPRGIELELDSDGNAKIWKLNTALEGTRPASMRWNQSSSAVIIEFGFVPVGSGGAFWRYYDPPEDEMLMCTHVDDFLITHSNVRIGNRFHVFYAKHYTCKYGPASEYVGLRLIRARALRQIFLSQSLLLDQLLEREYKGILLRGDFKGEPRYIPTEGKWAPLRPCSTPFDFKMSRLSTADSPAVPDVSLVHWMQRVLGSLMYILHTRPDVLHAVHQLARFVHNPGPSHVAALDHLLRYLAGTVDLTLIVGNWTEQDLKYDSGFHVYADASHKNVELEFKGITGVMVFVLGTLIQGRSFVQSQLAASSCEAEYYAYSSAAKEGESVRLLLRDLGILVVPTLLGDNQPAIATALGPSQRSRTRHIDFTLALCRDFVTRGALLVEYVPTAEQLADIYTKQLGPGPYTRHCGRFMSLIPFLYQ